MCVLIVDDHAYNRELLHYILEDEGLDCLEAENGQQAIDLVLDNPAIELVLMDVTMPVMDGIEATKIIKEKLGERFITIIFVTALDNSDVLVKCLDVGGDDFVPKPINENILLSKLQAHGRNRAMYNHLKSANEKLEYHKKLIDREHRVVEHIFSNDVNSSDTYCDNLQSYTSPASLFNGDLLLSAPSPSGGIYALVGDFTGHGLSAAVGSLPVCSIFYDCVSRQESISHIASLMNKKLLRLLPPGMFFCAALLYLEPKGRQLQLWLGGMNDLICKIPNQPTLAKIHSQHMPLGIAEENEFDDRIELFEFPIGSRLYIFTDGVNEAKNAKGEEFGLEAIDEIIINSESPIRTIIEQVRDFTAGRDQDDDVSLAELHFTPVLHRSRDTKEVIDVGADYRDAKSFPWKLKISLANGDLREADIVMQVGKFLGSIQGVELHQDKIFTIVSELYSNALEHGVLRLDSTLKSTPDGFDEYYRLREARLNGITGEAITVVMAYLRGDDASDTPNKLKIEISDSGDGFDIEQRKNQADNDESHGRGIPLLESLCESLEYSNGGRTSTAIYAFN